jgi:predicted alpha/beta hydrolase
MESTVQRIGHFGFFRDRLRDSLWQDAVAWMLGVKTGEPA